ncbi:FMN-binding protein [Protaetiibacter mangrovi]|uniref:FMN-binding protein n=1 Tax=Protaetiibacter mangrovi TaxID=2970926 RepID=A0ABT1ZGM5_9MICO|nr:FMN-binding protein [Protaetiibacter mangrovi]MCS0499765.1 FMN-binding protein [Protaetiibacter mangrovi]TPX03560.1 FMN-binding protein [Schumannella luteola]
MRTRAILGSALAAFSILAIGWEAGTSNGTLATTTTTDTGGTASGTTGTGSSSSSSSNTTDSGSTSGSDSSSSTTSTSGAADGTYSGSVESTRFGDVQVQVTISGGAITDVTALKLTDHDGRSVQISNRAAPILRQEVLASQSANVQMVGGATYTSEAYLSSLQSALDQAGF